MDWRTDVLLSLVRIGVQNPTLDRMHDVIEGELREVSKYVNEIANEVDTEYRDALIDEECERTEDLLGMAFMVAQSFITGVRTCVTKVSDVCKSNFGRGLSFPGDKGYGAFKLGPSFTAGPYTAVEVINAVANYWKHNDDWLTCEQHREGRIATVWDTSQMRSNEQKTVAIVTSLGLTFGSSGNLRAAAEALGVMVPHENLSPLRDVLRTWSNAVYDKTRQELVACGQGVR